MGLPSAGAWAASAICKCLLQYLSESAAQTSHCVTMWLRATYTNLHGERFILSLSAKLVHKCNSSTFPSASVKLQFFAVHMKINYARVAWRFKSCRHHVLFHKTYYGISAHPSTNREEVIDWFHCRPCLFLSFCGFYVWVLHLVYFYSVLFQLMKSMFNMCSVSCIKQWYSLFNIIQ